MISALAFGRRDFKRDERGVTAVEFGLLAPPFFLLMGALMQTSVIFLSSEVLESAVQDAARAVRTNQVNTTGNSIADFRARICGRLYGLFGDCSGLHIRVNPVSSFGTATRSPPVDSACTSNCTWTEGEQWSTGIGRDVILVQVYYRYPVIIDTGPLGMANMADGTRLLASTALFMNEPF